MVTTAEARFSNAFQTAADASASAMDVRTVLGDDVAERKRGTASPPSVAAEVRATSADATEPEDDEASDSERGGFGSEDELDSARSDADVSISADDDGTDHVGAEDNALDSTQITRLYQNKRKCEEREERRVAARLARLNTDDAAAENGEFRRDAASAIVSGGVGAFSATEGPSAAPGMTWEMKRAARDQIFSSSGAFQRLYSELFALQEKTDPRCACRVEAVDHDVYEWDVRYPASAFVSSDLRDDLELLEAVNGYGYVNLRVSFMPDLYPFYPPRVRVVRPRLTGTVASALAAHPAFHLRNWRPFTSASAVVTFARDFLVKCGARVDLESESNDRDVFSDPLHGAYADHPSRLESALARLAACGTSRGSPITPDAYAAAYAAAEKKTREENAEKDDDARDEEKEGVTFFRADLAKDDLGVRTEAKTKTGVSFAEMLAKDDPSGLDSEGARAAAEKNRLKRASSNAKAAETAEAWAKGTGYGYDAGASGGGGGGSGVNDKTSDGGKSAPAWDASAAREAQNAEDAVVRSLVAETTALIRVSFLESFESKDVEDDSSTRTKKEGTLEKDSEEEPLSLSSSTNGIFEHFSALFASMGKRARVNRETTKTAVRDSCVVAFAARELAGCAFMDMTSRASYYAALLDVVDAVARLGDGCAELLRGGGETNTNTKSSVAASLLEVSKQARVYLRSMEEVMAEGDAKDDAEWARNAATELALARRIIAVHDAVQAAAAGEGDEGAAGTEADGPLVSSAGRTSEPRRSRRGARAGPGPGPGPADPVALVSPSPAAAAPPQPKKPRGGKKKDTPGSISGFSDPEAFTCESAYCEALRDVVFDVVASPSDREPSGVVGAAFADEAARDLRAGPHLVRVAREMAGLSATLPISRSSSALVRVDEQKVVLWSIAVTGPEETPYDCGFFLFDAFFPSAYPACAPKVRFKTTGGGRARLNPNLYKDGKVCLSLLGTWSGAKGETWDGSCSTMAQVIVSIQSLIFVNEPFFNEPGYERGIGTADGKRKSDEYNRHIMEYTLRYAILEPLRKPNAAFKEAIHVHFKRRRQYIAGPMRVAWLRKAEAGGDEHRATMSTLFEEARVELEKL
jgi:baculoviral IAP repeat-containing protein 6